MSKRKKKLTPTDELIVQALLHIYHSNRVAVVDMEDGDLKPYTIARYVEMVAEKLAR